MDLDDKESNQNSKSAKKQSQTSSTARLHSKRTASQGSLRPKKKSPIKKSSVMEGSITDNNVDQVSVHVTGISVSDQDKDAPNSERELVGAASQSIAGPRLAIESDEESKKPRDGFRNMQDLFKAVKRADEQAKIENLPA